MKKFTRILSAFTLSALLFSGCSKVDSKNDETNDNTYDFTAILNDYADNTVVKTYADMKDRSKKMLEFVEAFKTTGKQADIDSACAAWRSTRVPWEQSESFLFGPAATNSLDPLLDSWPLDQAQLDQVLAGSQELTADYVRNALGAVLRGFHTIEYLLFRDGKPRTAEDVTTREKEYLIAVTEVLRDDCLNLWVLWNGNTNISDNDAAILEALEIEPDKGYTYEFKNAGSVGSRYLSQKDAVDEIIQGCMNIADEVANGKIADPYNTKDVLQVESWFSWNSLTDFRNNIISIQNSFYNGDNNLAALVKKINPELETQLSTKLAAAITAIDNIPAPFRNNLDKSSQIEAAMAAVNDITPVLVSIKGLFE